MRTITAINNIGPLEETPRHHHHATPGEPLKGSPGVTWWLYRRAPAKEPILFRVYILLNIIIVREKPPQHCSNAATDGGPRVVVSTAAFHARFRGSVPGHGGLKETKMFLPHPRVKLSIVGSLRDREVACSASDRQGSNFESCVWRTVSSQLSHHPQEVLLAQFSLYVHKGGLKPD